MVLTEQRDNIFAVYESWEKSGKRVAEKDSHIFQLKCNFVELSGIALHSTGHCFRKEIR